MVFFRRKKEAARHTAHVARPMRAVPALSRDRDVASTLIAPRITEKSASQNEQGVYTFVVRRSATKRDVRDAIRLLFKVAPRKVNIVHQAARTTHSRARGRAMVVPEMKKANVFLKAGDRIDLI